MSAQAAQADLLDHTEPAYPLPADEGGRLAALRSFGVLDQPARQTWTRRPVSRRTSAGRRPPWST